MKMIFPEQKNQPFLVLQHNSRKSVSLVQQFGKKCRYESVPSDPAVYFMELRGK